MPAHGSAQHRQELIQEKILHLVNDSMMETMQLMDTEGACCFSSDGEQIAIGGRKGEVVILDTSDWSRTELNLPKWSDITTLTFSPNNKNLAVG